MDLRFTLIIALLLLILMTVDMTWLDRANRRLKLGISKEKEAGAAKTDFLSRMSHDIRTPLNGIIGAAILAGREENPPRDHKIS
jgi:signal transduction histidine kinase